MDTLNRMFLHPAGGLYREFNGIKAYLPPRDLSLYRSLLPQPFDMPDSPLLMLFVADYVRVVSPPMRSYQEAAIVLRSRYEGATGWYVLTMPITNHFALWLGRLVGFPKYIEKGISLVADNECWRGQVKHEGRLWLSLEFRPGINGPLPAWAQEDLDAATFFHGDSYLLVPPGKGPQVTKIHLIYPIPPALPPVLGTACVTVDPGEQWAALADWETPAPAAYCHFVGGMSITAQRLT